MLNSVKIGFIGAGKIGQAFIQALVTSKHIEKEKIFIHDTNPVKMNKIHQKYGVINIANCESLIESADLVVLAIKAQNIINAIEPLSSIFSENQPVISLAKGIAIKSLKKILPQCTIARVMPNTPTLIQKGVIGYCVENNHNGLNSLIEELLSPLGYPVSVSEGEEFEALTVACGSGPGFIFELMQYWQEWIEARGFDSKTARKMTVETFVGSALLSQQSNHPFSLLIEQETSKRGVTKSGLLSMRELEIERLLRYSFEKAALRDQELGNQFS